MGLKKRISALLICSSIVLGSITPAYADGANVVTLGTNLSAEQKQMVLNYFGVKENEVVILEVNNQEERKYLEGVATEAQLGTRTYSCAYVQPTSKGNGLNVKTVNLTYVTSSMIASTLTTCGITDANVIAMTPLSGGVSGTGALTGIMKAFEDATGKPLDEEKKEIASEELVITGDLGENIGQDKATGVINDIKTEIIKNNTQDNIQIADTINNITNNYNVTLTPEQQEKLENLMTKVSEQDYDYKEMKDALNSVKDVVNEKLNSIGEKVPTTLINSVKQWFTRIGDWFANLFNNESKDLGILETTNDDLLGENAKIDATDNAAINQTSTEKEQGFFEKIWNWVTNLFSYPIPNFFKKFGIDSTSENSKSNNNTFEDNFNVDITESSGDSNSSNPSDLKDDKNTIDTNINESNNLENKNIN